VACSSLKVTIKKKLQNFHLTADWSTKGNITCLFGYTGSGKSLTLKTIAGLIKPDYGYITSHNVTFFDSDRRIDLPPQKRDIGFVFQNNMLFPHMTVYQNILYGFCGTGNDKKKRIGDILKIFRLDSLENRYPHQISGGQQQRTAIARAVMRGPKLLLLDEPFNSLDYAVKIKMYQSILMYKEYFDIPIILVTHDMDELRCLADWIVLYSEGRIEQEGTPEDVFLMPKNRVSARLVGTKNLLDGEVVGIKDGLAEIRTEKVTLFASVSNNTLFASVSNNTFSASGSNKMNTVKTGDKVICCIRPEYISFVADGASVESNRINESSRTNGSFQTNERFRTNGSFQTNGSSRTNESNRINTITGSVVNFMRNAASYDVFFRLEDRSYDLENNSYDFELKVRVEDFVNLGLVKGKKATITINENKIYLISDFL